MRVARVSVGVVVAFGLICRLSQYAAHTSLWHDEAFVALNVTQKSFAGLFGPLDWNEPSPPGFLVIEKLVVAAFGRSESALRLVPLLAGLGTMVGFAGLARLCCGSGLATLWAVLLMAASDKLIAQANEVKHFTLDLLWAQLLTLVALRCWLASDSQRQRIAGLLLWGTLGALGLWLSFASLFVFAGTSLVLAGQALRSWRARPRAAYLLANFMELGSLGLLGGPIRAQLTGTVVGFWTERFPDTSGAGALLYWFGRAALGLLNYFWQPLGAVMLVVVSLGALRFWRTGRRTPLLMLSMPVGLALAAAFLHRWPFGGNQHMSFAALAVLLLAGEGIEVMRRSLQRWRGWAGATCTALVLLPGVIPAAYRIVRPRLRHEIRPVIEQVQQRVEPDDQLLVFCPAEFEFYTGRNVRGTSTEPDARRRVWFIATRSDLRPFAAQDLLDRLSVRRVRLQAIEAYGAAAYLFAAEPR